MEVWGGIECSINRVGEQYFDQLDYHDQYHRTEDLEHLCALGITTIRYPVLWEKNWPVEHEPISWAARENLNALKNKGVTVIAGLVHHGSGPLYANVLSDSFPEKLAVYAGKVAEEFPWINHYTPINEPLTTARFCGLYGLWHPHGKDSRSFLQILINECKGTILAMQAIRKINPNARLIMTEDLSKIHSTPFLADQATFENHRRWLSIDLVCGRVTEEHPLYQYMLDEGISAQQLDFFIAHSMPPDVLGFNYYITSERFLDEALDLYPKANHGGNGRQVYADTEAVRTDKAQIDGLEKLLQSAWERYRIPLAITEAHLSCGREDQLRWLDQVWQAALNLSRSGVKIEGVTFWSLFGAYGWDKLLTMEKGNYETGVFDLSSGRPRATALTRLIRAFAAGQPYHHPVLDGQGWWDRPVRLLHPGDSHPVILKDQEASSPILIIGAAGTLGQSFMRACRHRGLYYHSLTRKELSLGDPVQLARVIAQYKPWAIINAAGFVKIDDAELKPEDCFLSNTHGPTGLAVCCRENGIKLITFSSHLVFDGKKRTCYFEDDAVNPLSVYGMSKAWAEHHILQENPDALVIRPGAFFSPQDPHNFVSSVIRTLKNGQPLMAADDVFISPTYVPDLVNASLDLLIDDERGIWHLANNGMLSWYDFAREIADRGRLDSKLIAGVPLASLGLKARRPFYSALKTRKGITLPSLSHALDHCFTGF